MHDLAWPYMFVLYLHIPLSFTGLFTFISSSHTHMHSPMTCTCIHTPTYQGRRKGFMTREALAMYSFVIIKRACKILKPRPQTVKPCPKLYHSNYLLYCYGVRACHDQYANLHTKQLVLIQQVCRSRYECKPQSCDRR